MLRINKIGHMLFAIATMAMMCQSFVPNGRTSIITSPRMQIQSTATRIGNTHTSSIIFPSRSTKESKMIRYVSGGASDVPEPEKKTVSEKV